MLGAPAAAEPRLSAELAEVDLSSLGVCHRLSVPVRQWQGDELKHLLTWLPQCGKQLAVLIRDDDVPSVPVETDVAQAAAGLLKPFLCLPYLLERGTGLA